MVFADAIANMPALEFLASFQPNGDFVKFLNEKDNKELKYIPGLQNAMLALRDTHSQIASELRGVDGAFDKGDQLSKKINGLSSDTIKNGSSSGSALVSFTRNFDPAIAKQKLRDLLTESKKIVESSNLASESIFRDLQGLSDVKLSELLKANGNPYRIPAQVNPSVQQNLAEQDVVDDANPFQFYPQYA